MKAQQPPLVVSRLNFITHLLYSLRRHYGGNCATLLDHHSLLVTSIDLLPM